MNWLLILSVIATIVEISSYLEEHVINYFNSELVHRSIDIWQKHRVSYQNMISVALQESFGYNGMNVYIQPQFNPLYVCKGYYHSDNQVHLVLQDLKLEGYPHISDPEVSFPLPVNVIKVETVVSKITVHASYIVYRNTSHMVYDLKDQDSSKTSPFLFEQVKTKGRVAITAEGCKLSGIGITTLTGLSVSLGNIVFRLLDCQFKFEIYSPGIPSPPVIANYQPNSEGLTIEHLIMRPLYVELTPKLQAAIHAHVNASSVFQESLGDIRINQEQIFEQTTNYMNNVIRNLNVLTITKNMGKIVMEDFKIPFNDTLDEGEVNSVLTLSNMVLTGLETVYSSHTGGPFKLTTLKISEELRFGTLQVRGSIDLQYGEKTKEMFDFAVEINDVEVDVTVNIVTDDKGPSRSIHITEVMGWRSFQFSSPGMLTGETIVTGYLTKKIPLYLTNFLNVLLPDAAREADKEYAMLEDGKISLAGNNEYNDEQGGENYDNNIDNEQENPDYDTNNYTENYEGNAENNDEYEESNVPEAEKNADEAGDGMVGDIDNPGVIIGVTHLDDQEPVTGPGGIAVEDVPAPEGIDYQEPPQQPSEFQLQPKFFDENMFQMVKSQNHPILRRKKQRMRAQKLRRWHKNKVLRATRTTKSVQYFTQNGTRF